MMRTLFFILNSAAAPAVRNDREKPHGAALHF
jgi:hypothetical protein